MKRNNYGFHLVAIALVVVVAGVIGLVGWKVFSQKDPVKSASSEQTPPTGTTSDSKVLWSTDADGNWKALSSAPNCPSQPMLKMPADVTKVTSVLYPGQTRGGNYKPHGGLRFDNVKDNKVTVTAPMDGYIYRGARYLVDGEMQYTFDIINSCGVMYRLGHFLTLAPKYQALAEKFPAATEGDSRTSSVESYPSVKTGEIIATAVGVTKGGVNTFFDFGVYDLRNPNAVSQTAAYQAKHTSDKELSWHAVCWLKDWLPGTDSSKLLTLPPGDPTSGKNSDYCK